MDWTSIIITAIINIPAFVLIGQQLKKEKAVAKKTSVEATDVQVGTSLDLVREMREQIASANKKIEDLEKSRDEQAARLDAQGNEIDELKRENFWLRRGVGILIQQLRRHDIKPEFTLED